MVASLRDHQWDVIRQPMLELLKALPIEIHVQAAPHPAPSSTPFYFWEVLRREGKGDSGRVKQRGLTLENLTCKSSFFF